MANNRLDVIGKTFNYVTIISATEERKKTIPLYLCRCVCGTEFLSGASNIANGNKKSCGCKRGVAQIGRANPQIAERNKANAKHGMADTGIHGIWSKMRQRCENPTHKNFHNYGGRGIFVCERWQSFENFFADMGEKPEGCSLERINNDLEYSPDNVVWATMKQQANNRRSNVFVEFAGKTKTVAEWAEETGLECKTLEYRIRVGWTPERALTTPSLIKRKEYHNGHIPTIDQ